MCKIMNKPSRLESFDSVRDVASDMVGKDKNLRVRSELDLEKELDVIRSRKPMRRHSGVHC